MLFNVRSFEIAPPFTKISFEKDVFIILYFKYKNNVFLVILTIFVRNITILKIYDIINIPKHCNPVFGTECNVTQAKIL